MKETLGKLAVEAQKFMNKQIMTTKEFDEQKQQIFGNDRKKESFLKQKEELQLRNTKRNQQIKQKTQTLNKKKKQLQEIRINIKKFQIYEQFLKEVRALSDDFSGVELEQITVMTILQRYYTMEKKKMQLADLHKKIEIEKEIRMKNIQRMKKDKEENILYSNSKVKDLKEKIDRLTQQNIYLESELQGKLNENGERQRQVGQVIFSIRGLYQSIVGEDKQFKNTIEMLNVIKQQRKKLKEYLDLYQQKTDERKKNG